MLSLLFYTSGAVSNLTSLANLYAPRGPEDELGWTFQQRKATGAEIPSEEARTQKAANSCEVVVLVSVHGAPLEISVTV